MGLFTLLTYVKRYYSHASKNIEGLKSLYVISARECNEINYISLLPIIEFPKNG